LLVESPEKKFLASAGVENSEMKNPMQVYHTMPTASSGKPMIVLLATILSDEDLLDLDATLDTWFDSDILAKIENSNAITLHNYSIILAVFTTTLIMRAILKYSLANQRNLKLTLIFYP